MKQYLKHILKFSLAFLMLVTSVCAQDPHFTQFHRIPTYYNPACAGQDVEHIRLTMLYRNQWASVTSPFVTQSVFFDKQVSKIGLGATLINNTSGDAGFRQFYINGTLSYRATLGNHQFAGGVQLGLIQKSFDPSKMTFDDQYNPDQGYNSSNSTNETFSYTKLIRPDFGLGFLWTYGQKKENSFHPYFGMSFQHINQSKETFIETTNIIPRKIVMQGGVGIHVNEQLDLIPMFMFQQQQFSKELMYGIIGKVPLQDRNHFEVGVFHRKKDAVSAYVGYQWNSYMLGASYDVNISGLSGGQGAFEITLTYIPKAKIKAPPKSKKEKEEKDSKPLSKLIDSKKIVDRDKDGIEDKKDKCPNIPGLGSLNGCPVRKIVAKKLNPNGISKPIAKTEIKPEIKSISNIVITPSSTSITIPELILDTDKDGIPDKKDDCPNVIGIASLNGCPTKIENITPKKYCTIINSSINEIILLKKTTIPTFIPIPVAIDKPEVISDIDHDGIQDKVDECPNVAGIEKLKGCPVKIEKIKSKDPNKIVLLTALKVAEPIRVIVPKIIPFTTSVEKPEIILDSDNDGVPDNVDECPYIKGSLQTHGCPDTDGDGIVDAKDPCPFAAGKNGGNGCPEIEITSTVFIESKNIEFASNSIDVRGIYKLDIIEPALDSIYDNANYTLVITGHTDGEGDAAFNMNLSQARANQVKAIFIKKGLAEDRIVTVAYGETMPIANNNAELGRSHNRRVEIHIVKINKH